MRSWQRWIPATLLASGALLNSVLVGRRAESTPLVGPIESVAVTAMGLQGTSLTIDSAQQKVAGMTTFTLREFTPPGKEAFTIYVGYYDEQHQGKTIHSPKNCLPAGGWEPVEKGTLTVAMPGGDVKVNRYRVAQQGRSAVVYYWYQGRGRVAYDEFRVKFELLRDAALHGRTEEALVRIVMPVTDGDVESADALARKIAPGLITDVNRILPPL
jgi:EpsI family protein